MLCYNEATSVNCSEGWWLHRDDYYTLGSLCTRLFFYCCYYFPSSLFSCYQTCSWTSVQHRGSLKMLWTGFCSVIFVLFVCFGLLSALELQFISKHLIFSLVLGILYWCHFSFVDYTQNIVHYFLITSRAFMLK